MPFETVVPLYYTITCANLLIQFFILYNWYPILCYLHLIYRSLIIHSIKTPKWRKFFVESNWNLFNSWNAEFKSKFYLWTKSLQKCLLLKIPSFKLQFVSKFQTYTWAIKLNLPVWLGIETLSRYFKEKLIVPSRNYTTTNYAKHLCFTHMECVEGKRCWSFLLEIMLGSMDTSQGPWFL